MTDSPPGRRPRPGQRLALLEWPDPPGSVAAVTPATLTLFSVATGQPERVLYRAAGRCTADGPGALSWAGSASQVVVMINTGTIVPGQPFTSRIVIGLLAGGKLLPVTTGGFSHFGPGAIAF